MRCVLDPGDSIVDCPPTFTMYVFDAAVNNARVVTVPRLEGFRLDVAGEPPVLRPQALCINLRPDAYMCLTTPDALAVL